LPDVPLLLVCGTIGACDDFDGIVEWREDNLPFLRRFLSHHHGVPGSRWLRILLNRIDPALSSEMFQSRAATLRPQAPALVAIDGKTSRASHDRRHGRAALHLVSTFATRGKLVLAQEAVAAGGGEQTTIPLLLERLAQKGQIAGALVSIDAIACNGGTAQAILDAGADYLLAVMANQSGLMGEIERFFDDPSQQGVAADTATDTPVNPDSGPRLIMPRLSSKAALWEAASRRRSPYDKINQLTLTSSSSVENSPCSVHSGQVSVVRSQRDAQSLWLSLVQHCCQTAKSRTRVRQRRYVSSAGSMASNSIGLSKSRSGGPGSPGGPAAPSPL
jgi:predicted transposase YbfD/YdcC